MFRQIVVPTDGSPLSEQAALKSIELARGLGARITAIHVSPPFHVLAYTPDILQHTREQYEVEIERQASRVLGSETQKVLTHGQVPVLVWRS